MIPKNLITNAALEIGFDIVGVVPAMPLEEEAQRFGGWIDRQYHSTLAYLERNGEKRFDASKLVEGARSVVVCGVAYLSEYSRGYPEGWRTKIASYALNRDYHLTIKEMLVALAERLKEYAPGLRFRAFTDSAPLAEKSYARRAGLGWIGRNSLLVTPEYGSMLLLGELVINEDVDEYDAPKEFVGCGECRRCVEACPNGAILEDRMIDTRRCISCRTIEPMAEGDNIDLDGWIFGCDACQSVCPYNQRAKFHRNTNFDPIIDPLALDSEAWLSMTEEEFSSLAASTPMTRAGLERIRENVEKVKSEK
ncbi:MAG: tRNA epoxyqueuosine(34) reductase QueG [Alistipes sp.]|nr:tRNA epoxyqueuosine(34) reductase QueG [Alistipes sp.]